jgi:hypothetical protein
MDVTYVNCGDWVDSCTAIVEHHDGRLELIRAWQPAVAAVSTETLANAVPPAPTPADLPLPDIACGAEAARL